MITKKNIIFTNSILMRNSGWNCSINEEPFSQKHKIYTTLNYTKLHYTKANCHPWMTEEQWYKTLWPK